MAAAARSPVRLCLHGAGGGALASPRCPVFVIEKGEYPDTSRCSSASQQTVPTHAVLPHPYSGSSGRLVKARLPGCPAIGWVIKGKEVNNGF